MIGCRFTNDIRATPSLLAEEPARRSCLVAGRVGWVATPDLGGGQVAVLHLHAASAGHGTKAASSCLRAVYVRWGTKHVRAPRKRPNFGELRKGEVRRIFLPRHWVNKTM